MTTISLEKGTLKLTSYDGLAEKCRRYSVDGPTMPDPLLNFFREGDNHFYTRGETFSSNCDCNNNLIISDYKGISLENISNAFVVANSSEVTIMPISDVNEVIKLGMKLLPRGNIQYHMPQNVFRRENSPGLTSEEIKEILKDSYHLDAKEVSAITSGRSKEGVYHVFEEDGREFVFKFRRGSEEYVKNLSGILIGIADYFPKIHPRRDNPALTFLKMRGGGYWLEDFIRGDSLERTHPEYPSLMGHLIAGLHQSLGEALQKNDNLRNIFSSKGDFFGESTLLSLYLDLAKGGINRDFLLPPLKKIIKRGLSNDLRVLPISLIHGDLNNSNIFLEDNLPRVIDYESFRVAPRINEFVAPLILEGNQDPPNYIRGSLLKVVEAHDRISRSPLFEGEKRVLSDLLGASMLRHHVVRNIRKSISKEDSSRKIEESLKFLEEDKKK